MAQNKASRGMVPFKEDIKPRTKQRYKYFLSTSIFAAETQTVAWTKSVEDIRNSITSRGSFTVIFFNHKTGISMQPGLSLNIDVTTKVHQCFGDKISAKVLLGAHKT